MTRRLSEPGSSRPADRQEPMFESKPLLIAAGLLVVLGAGLWYFVFRSPDELPPGFAKANGRIEAERVDVAARFAGRLEEITVSEGDLVEAGQIVARLDDAQLQAQLREAEAGVFGAAGACRTPRDPGREEKRA